MSAETADDRKNGTDERGRSEAERDTVYSPRTRRAGGVMFLLTGGLGTLLALALLGYAVVGGFAGVPPVTIALFALPTLVGGVIQLYGGVLAWRGRRWRVVMAIGVIGLLFSPNPVLIPVKVVALVLLGISEDQFA